MAKLFRRLTAADLATVCKMCQAPRITRNYPRVMEPVADAFQETIPPVLFLE